MRALVDEELVSGSVYFLHVELAGDFGEGPNEFSCLGNGRHRCWKWKALCAGAVELAASRSAGCRQCALQLGA